MPTRLVVADTWPLNYLVLIDAIEVLPNLFEQILMPAAVRDELDHADTPPPVRAFIAESRSGWRFAPTLPVCDVDSIAPSLGEGERAAIALATTMGADLVLMDDRAGVAVAYRYGLAVTGTLGVLDLASRRGFLSLATAFAKLRATNFHYPPEIMEACWPASESRENSMSERQTASATRSIQLNQKAYVRKLPSKARSSCPHDCDEITSPLAR